MGETKILRWQAATEGSDIEFHSYEEEKGNSKGREERIVSCRHRHVGTILGIWAERNSTDEGSSREAPSHPSLKIDTSEYDEFDREANALQYGEDDTDVEDEDEDGMEDSQSIYSDFNVLDSSDSASESCDASFSFDGLYTGYQYAVDPGGKAIDLVMENERHDEVSVAPAGSGFSRRFLPSAVVRF